MPPEKLPQGELLPYQLSMPKGRLVLGELPIFIGFFCLFTRGEKGAMIAYTFYVLPKLSYGEMLVYQLSMGHPFEQ